LTTEKESKMTLHEAIVRTLLEHGRDMTTSEIATALNASKLYTKKDGSEIDTVQVHGRTRNYPDLFRRAGSMVALTDEGAASIGHEDISQI
jgi:hypothetical protein